jgi:hypothetical protein
MQLTRKRSSLTQCWLKAYSPPIHTSLLFLRQRQSRTTLTVYQMNPRIPYPRIVRKTTPADPGQDLTQGDLVSVLQSIWRKFNDIANLSNFRHNLRAYYDENSPATVEELAQIRSYLSDPGLRIYIMHPGESFRWDKRTTTASRKIIYLSQRWLDRFDMINQFTDGQKNALRLAFMQTLIHALGDYITVWARDVNMAPDQHTIRYEGGTETEYVFFGGLLEGVSLDHNNNFRLDYVRCCLFDGDRATFWTIPDNVARDLYANGVIEQIVPSTLTKWSGVAHDPASQTEYCCGFHRVSWKPNRRPRQPPSTTETSVPNVPAVHPYPGSQMQQSSSSQQPNYHPTMFQPVQVPPQGPYSSTPMGASQAHPQQMGLPVSLPNVNFNMFGSGGGNLPNTIPAGGNLMTSPGQTPNNWSGHTHAQYPNYQQVPVTPGT